MCQICKNIVSVTKKFIKNKQLPTGMISWSFVIDKACFFKRGLLKKTKWKYGLSVQLESAAI